MMLPRTKSDRAVPQIMRHHAAPAKGVSFQQQPWLCGPVHHGATFVHSRPVRGKFRSQVAMPAQGCSQGLVRPR